MIDMAVRVKPEAACDYAGVLAEIEALGLDLLEIQKLTPDRKSPEPGDRRPP